MIKQGGTLALEIEGPLKEVAAREQPSLTAPCLCTTGGEASPEPPRLLGSFQALSCLTDE